MAEQISAAANDALELVCPACGYDLRAIASARCPECGHAIDRQSMSVSRIPWAHRQSIGRWRAYWRTNLMVLSSPRRLADEIARPVSFADAQRFRHVTVLIAWLPLLASFVAILAINWSQAMAGFGSPATHLGWWLEAAIYISLLAAFGLTLLMGSGLGSYFYHPTDLPVVQQNRAIALSHYMCAPLAWLWLPAVCGAISIGLSEIEWGQFGVGASVHFLLGLATAGFLMVVVVMYWSRVVQLMSRVTHRGAGRTLAMTVYLPLAWAICTAVALLIPATVFYVSLVILSFR